MNWPSNWRTRWARTWPARARRLDEGWITEEQVVGATGETVRPDLYVAVGIRGDTYHAFGIRDAKFVVAIHPEKDAPILKSADAALVGDPRQACARVDRGAQVVSL